MKIDMNLRIVRRVAGFSMAAVLMFPTVSYAYVEGRDEITGENLVSYEGILTDDDTVIIDDTYNNIETSSVGDDSVGAISDKRTDEKLSDDSGLSDEYKDCDDIEVETASKEIASGKCGMDLRLSWSLMDNGMLTISGASSGINATAANISQQPWREYIDQITSIEIKDYVTHLYGPVFWNMPNLESIYFKSSSFESFYWADSARDHAPNHGMFEGCPKLTVIKSDKLRGYGHKFEFYSPKNSNSFLLSNDLTGEIRLLAGCKTSIIPSEVTTIYENAFAGIDLTETIIPLGVDKIMPYAYANDANLQYAVVPASLKELDPAAFYGCTSLRDIFYGGSAEDWTALMNANEGTAEALKDIEVHYGSSSEKPKTCKVTFNSNGGSSVDSIDVIPGRTIKTLPVSVKKAFVFKGWFTDKDFLQEFIAGSTPVSSDITLFARFEPAKLFKYEFYTDPSEPVYITGSIYEDELLNKPTPDPVKAGYKFIGWYIDLDELIGYDFDKPVTGDVRLYARWVDETLNGYWSVSKVLLSGSVLTADMYYSNKTEYDGRKHVIEGTKKADMKVNPDIKCDRLNIALNGVRIKGISVAGYKYKNNQYPAVYDDERYRMQIIPVLKYDSKDDHLKQILKAEKDLKKELSAMMSPKAAYNKEENDWIGYEPILVNMDQIWISNDTPVYTQADLKKDPALKDKDGILVYNGKISLTFKKVNDESGGHKYYVTSGTAGNLSYQTVYTMSDGSKKAKQLKLRSGKWTVKVNKYRMGGENFIDSWTYTKGTYDYIVNGDTDPGEDLNLVLNDDGSLGENVKRGYFAGTLPVFERSDADKDKEAAKYK